MARGGEVDTVVSPFPYFKPPPSLPFIIKCKYYALIVAAFELLAIRNQGSEVGVQAHLLRIQHGSTFGNLMVDLAPPYNPVNLPPTPGADYPQRETRRMMTNDAISRY